MRKTPSNHRDNGRDDPRRRTTPAGTPGAARHQTATVGVLEWFRLGEHDRVDRVLADLRSLGIE